MDYLSSPDLGTANTDVAAALAGLSIPLREEAPWKRTIGEVEQVSFFFEQRSACGNFETREMVRAWDDEDWQRARPQHPLTYQRVFFRNRHRFRDHFRRRVPIAAVWRRGKMEIVRVGRSALDLARSVEPPPQLPDGAQCCEVTDDSLAAALCAVGIPLDRARPWRFDAQSRPVFRFHPVSPDGSMRTAELILAFGDLAKDGWWSRHAEHPFAYVLCAAANHEWFVARVRESEPMVVLKRGGVTGLLPAGANDGLQKVFFDEFNRY